MGLRERDLAARATRVGASNAAIFTPEGHPYWSLAQEYARLVHGIETPFKQIMGVGQYMEDTIFEWWRPVYAERGITVRQNSVSTIRDRYTATPDGYCQHDDGQAGVIEVKNVSRYAVEHWDNDAVPPWYVAQVQLAMYATRRTHCHVWALLAGSQFIERHVDADPAYQQGIVDAIDRFFDEHVEPRIPPPTDDGGLLLTFTRPAGVYAADGYYKVLGDDLAEAGRIKADATSEYDTIRNELMLAMARGDVRELFTPDWTAKAAPPKEDGGKWTLRFNPKRTNER